MANFTAQGVVGGGEPENRVFDVASGTTASIQPGDLVVIADGYAAKIANGGAGAGNGLYGFAVSASNETASAAGTVEVEYHPAGLIVRGKVTTPASLVKGMEFDKVSVDVSGAVQTIDQSNAGALLIYALVGTDFATTGLVDVVVPFTLAS